MLRGQRIKDASFCVKSDGLKGDEVVALRLSSLSPLPRAFGGGSFRVGDDIHPLRMRRRFGSVVVVPVPPLVRRGLRITLRRVLPSFLTAERREVEVAPGASHRLVAAAVDEVCAEHLVAVAEEHIVAVPLVDAEVFVEAVCHGVPGHTPSPSAPSSARCRPAVRVRRRRGWCRGRSDGPDGKPDRRQGSSRGRRARASRTLRARRRRDRRSTVGGPRTGRAG